jgi:hypothetical protein
LSGIGKRRRRLSLRALARRRSDPWLSRLGVTAVVYDPVMSREPDDVMVLVGQAIERGQQGDVAGARLLLEDAWARVGPVGDALHRCAIAHSMADVQDDPHGELVWDLRALEAAEGVTDERVAEAGMPGSAEGLFPSLHLNLADVYRRLGEADRAREHVARGSEVLDALGDDGYGQMIAAALRRVEDELSAG